MIDLYTKTVLTIIAAALLWIGIQLTPTVSAGPEVVAVDIVKVGGGTVGHAFTPAIAVEIVKK